MPKSLVSSRRAESRILEGDTNQYRNTRTVFAVSGGKTAAIRRRGLVFGKSVWFNQTEARKRLSSLSDLCLVFLCKTLHVGFFYRRATR
ncbi:hypothetical protein [Pseudomonas fluorescens]|uniref:hypothetical protein n=1 Tax=Pseudomonas fluorescens TaxID=294 RepID=UPI0012417959|nr:hypothetical protein [Pseudomonas fluorescens]